MTDCNDLQRLALSARNKRQLFHDFVVNIVSIAHRLEFPVPIPERRWLSERLRAYDSVACTKPFLPLQLI
jgi:hypothetical protein